MITNAETFIRLNKLRILFSASLLGSQWNGKHNPSPEILTEEVCCNWLKYY